MVFLKYMTTHYEYNIIRTSCKHNNKSVIITCIFLVLCVARCNQMGDTLSVGKHLLSRPLDLNY